MRPMAPPRKLRAKRARARWREKRGHDLRPQYREADLPATAHIAVATIEDAYAPAGRVDRAGNLDVEARLEPVHHRDGSLSEGAGMDAAAAADRDGRRQSAR